MLINELTYQFTYAIIDLQISIKVITHLFYMFIKVVAYWNVNSGVTGTKHKCM